MSDEPPATRTFLQARHYTPGRLEAVRLLVIHTTESPCAPGVARNVARWFAGNAAPQASAHFVVGPDEVIACVAEGDTAWHAPPCNPYAVGVEHTGRASFTAADWASGPATAMLDRSAALVAEVCARNGIPVAFIDVDGLLAGESGITTHACVSNAFHQTDHTDPGNAFPTDDYLTRVAAASGGGSPTQTAP